MLLILLVCSLLLISAAPIRAQVVISEVYPAPSKDTEWIELYNQSSEQSFELNHYTLQDQLSSPSLIYTFAENTTLPPQTYLAIDLTQPKLNNSADGVTLLNPQQKIIDEMSYDKTEADLSWSLTPNQDFILTTPSKNKPNLIPSPTPSPSQSPTPSPSPSPSPTTTTSPSPSPTPKPDLTWHKKIKIASFVACPQENETESVTLLNTDQQTHTLSNWRLRDESQQTRKVNLTLNAQQKQTISWGNHLLNNDGDTIQLEAGNGKIIQTLTYQDCQTENQPTSATTPTTAPSPPSNTSSTTSKTSTPNPSTPTPPPKPPTPPTLLLSSNQPKTPQFHLPSTTPPLPPTKTLTQPSTPSLSALSGAIMGGCLLLINHGWPFLKNIFPLFAGPG